MFEKIGVGVLFIVFVGVLFRFVDFVFEPLDRWLERRDRRDSGRD